jgi:hypothetical protein
LDIKPATEEDSTKSTSQYHDSEGSMTYEESVRKDLRMLKSAKAKREFMNGFKFSLRMVGF